MHEPERRVTVDKQSIDYQLGAIITRIDGQNGQLADLTKGIGQLTEKIGDLPCASHNLRLEGLETKRVSRKKAEQWQTQNKITFKQGLMVAVLASLISASTYLLLGIVI